MIEKPKLICYFSHAWSSEVSGAAKLTLHLLRKALPEIDIQNPFEHDLTPQYKKNPHSITLSKAIIRKDVEMIKDCDLVIAYLPRMIGETKYEGSWGTAMELWISRMELNKSVYALCGQIHPWLLGLEIKMEEDLDTLIKRIRLEMKLDAR